jgi:DNA-binding MarR family transcriptional regulator
MMSDRQTTSTSDTTDAGAEIPELAARLRLTTARLARQLRQQAGTGLSPSQHAALASIELHGPLTLGQLARIEQVAPPTVTKVVARLEEDGLVTRTVDRTDRRIARVSATAAGRRRLEQSRKRRNAWLARRLRAADADQVRRLAAALPLLEELAAAPGDSPPSTTTDTDTGDTTETTETTETTDIVDTGRTGEGARGATAAPERVR